ncbi:MAG TPA: cytochrome P450 [Solirubrobacterales bacterium]|nr:cytochrome P450 [Solirubrobacterales bacterium]
MEAVTDIPTAAVSAAPELPPGPDWSVARSTFTWWRRPLQTLEECRARYGDMFTYRIAHEGTWVFVSDPEAVKQVFTGDPRLLHAGEANIVLLPVLGEHSVLLLDEPAHMRERKLMLPPFHGKRMQAYREVMARVAAEEIERWPTDRPVRMRPRMQAVTLEVILRAVFGVGEGDALTALRDELRSTLNLLGNPRRAIFLVLLGPERLRRFPPFRRRLERVDALLFEEIAARRVTTDLAEREDILSLLLQARREDGSPMSDRELRDELMTLLVAGHETTATALSWAVELLARHPDALGRLEGEVAAGGDEYLDAVIKETLRLRPVIALVLRKLVEPMEIGGRLLPAGVSVAPSIYLAHRNPEVYPEPERFRPERFLEQQAGTYTWIPFGGGVRRCLGGAFAEFEMAVVLRELVSRRAIRPVGTRPEHSVRSTITNVPSRGAEVIAGAR